MVWVGSDSNSNAGSNTIWECCNSNTIISTVNWAGVLAGCIYNRGWWYGQLQSQYSSNNRVITVTVAVKVILSVTGGEEIE